jgi:hypothetical protein
VARARAPARNRTEFSSVHRPQIHSFEDTHVLGVLNSDGARAPDRFFERAA